MFRTYVLRALGAAAIFTACAVPALADPLVAPSASPSPTPIPEIGHVVTSDRADETLKNTARTTYVVTQDQIVQNDYRTVGEALADVPGVEISNYGAIGSTVSYGIRGSSSAQVLVLIDGLPAPGSLADSVDLGQFSTIGVRRIEVVEGGGSTLYGTGAIGGIINIITNGQHVPTSASLQYGSFDDRELRFETNGISFERIVADNAFGLPGGTAGVPGTRDNSAYEETSGSAGFDHKIGTIDASLRASLSSSNLGVPGSIQFLSPTSSEQNVNGDANLAFSHHGAQSTSTLQFGGTRQQIAFSCNDNQAVDPNCFQQPSLSTESRLALGLRNVVSGVSERFIYGIDLSRGDVRSDDGNGDVSINSFAQTAAYTQENFILAGGSSVYAGLRGERDGALGGELSPSIGSVIRLPNELSLKLNYATAFRAPNASELYFPGYGNSSLHPERAKVGDASLVDPNLLGGATLTWFTNRTDDLIVPVEIDKTTFTYQPQNIDHALMQGFTFDIKTRPYDGVYTGINATDLYAAEDLDAQTRLPHDPVMTVNLQVGVLGNGHSAFQDAQVSIRAVGARDTIDYTQPQFDQAVAYTSLDAYVRFRLAPNAILSLRGYNLGNERYAEVAGYPMPGRSFAVQLSTR